MSQEFNSQQPQVQMEELARPEEALTAEQADEVQGGLTTTLGTAAPPESEALLLPAVQKVREAASRM